MKNHEKFINFCKGNNNEAKILGIHADLIKLMRSIDKKYGIEEAAFLSQLIYWSDRSNRKDGYFYKSDKEWESELGLSRYKLDRMREIFCKLGYIKIKKVKANGAPTRHYRVNMDKILNDLKLFYQLEQLIDSSVCEDEMVKNKQMEMEVSLNSDMQITDNSELQETDNSLTENTHKLQHRLEQKTPVLNHGYKNVSPEKNENMEKETEWKQYMYTTMIEQIEIIFPHEDLDKRKLEQIHAVAYSINCCSRGSNMYSKEKPDHTFILEKLKWASKIAREDPTFTFNNLMVSLAKPENIEKYHEHHDTKRKSGVFDRDRISSPMDYFHY